MATPFESPSVLSICPGILGLERGLERAIGKLRVIAYAEIEAFCIANLIAGMESGVLDTAPVWTDVKTFPSFHFRNKIHGIIGGYPCQPFSLAGNRMGTEDARHLWLHIKRIINTVRPIWCFFENVDDHLSLGFPEVQASLWRMGYRVEAGIFSAVEVGAPHERQRLFILAIKVEYALHPEIERSGIRNDKTLPCNRSTSIVFPNSNKIRCTSWRAIGNNDNGESNGSKEKVGKCVWDQACRFCSNVSNSSCKRECKGSQRVKSELTYENEFERGANQFPSKPREQQHVWEEKRTVESGMGCTIDGYNFREDLLRAYGNSVVEQTAELAFRTLIEKFNK